MKTQTRNQTKRVLGTAVAGLGALLASPSLAQETSKSQEAVIAPAEKISLHLVGYGESADSQSFRMQNSFNYKLGDINARGIVVSQPSQIDYGLNLASL